MPGVQPGELPIRPTFALARWQQSNLMLQGSARGCTHTQASHSTEFGWARERAEADVGQAGSVRPDVYVVLGGVPELPELVAEVLGGHVRRRREPREHHRVLQVFQLEPDHVIAGDTVVL